MHTGTLLLLNQYYIVGGTGMGGRGGGAIKSGYPNAGPVGVARGYGDTVGREVGRGKERLP